MASRLCVRSSRANGKSRVILSSQRPLRCGVESLEARTLLAGDLLVGLANDGTVSVLGDDAGNGAVVRSVHEEIPDSLLVTGGKTSVSLDLPLLESVGLVLSGADADAPAPGYLVGFPITPPTDFRISIDGSVPPLGGIEHSGTVRFNDDSLTVGDFTIGFDGSRVTEQASGFYVLDTVTFDAVLFDIGAPEISVEGSELTVTTDQLLVSPELAGVLGNSALTGVDVGDALVEADVAVLQQRQVHGGVTSVGLDLDGLAGVGLILTGSEGVTDPADGPFLVGFPIGADADFQFSLTDGTLSPLSGVITHTGTITFNDAVTVGQFEIGFDASRVDESTGATGFYVRDTFSLGAILFDVAAPDGVELDDPTFSIGPANLLVSSEFANFLENPALVGANVGDAQIDATVNPVTVPYLQIKGVASMRHPTTVNGNGAVAFPLSEVSNLRVDVAGGKDYVRLHGVELPGSITIDLGDGFYNSTFLDDIAAASLTVLGGSGRDHIYSNRVSTDHLTIDTKEGADFVSLHRTQVSTKTDILLGAGRDVLSLFRASLEGETKLDGGAGPLDLLFARYSDFEGEVVNFRWKLTH